MPYKIITLSTNNQKRKEIKFKSLIEIGCIAKMAIEKMQMQQSITDLDLTKPENITILTNAIATSLSESTKFNSSQTTHNPKKLKIIADIFSLAFVAFIEHKIKLAKISETEYKTCLKTAINSFKTISQEAIRQIKNKSYSDTISEKKYTLDNATIQNAKQQIVQKGAYRQLSELLIYYCTKKNIFVVEDYTKETDTNFNPVFNLNQDPNIILEATITFNEIKTRQLTDVTISELSEKQININP